MKKYSKGFTLIELLVVIAIIGILSSVVLASLNTARNKGKAAAVQTSMSQLRAQAEMGVGTGGSYLIDLCNIAGSTAGGLKTLTDAATNGGGTDLVCGQDTAVGVAPTKWAAAIVLPAGGNYCVDSTGYAGPSTVVPATEIAGGYSSGDVACDNT